MPASCRRLAAAALVPSSLALVLQTFPRHKIPVAVAIWGAVGAVAGAAGPTLGALVIENLGWRWAFYINLPVGIVSFVLGRRVLPEWREQNPGRLPDAASVALLTAGLALAAYGIVQTEKWGWGSGRFVLFEFVAAALVALFVRRSSTVTNPVLDLTLFESQSFRWANAATIVFATGFSAMFLGNVLFLTSVWHYSILRAGLAISVGPLIVAVTAPLFGRLAGRVGQRRLLIPGGLVWAVQRAAADHQGDDRPRLRRPLPPVRCARWHRRRAVPPAALVGGGSGTASSALRFRFGGQPGSPQPRRHTRRCRRGGVHRRRRSGDGARRLSSRVVAARDHRGRDVDPDLPPASPRAGCHHRPGHS